MDNFAIFIITHGRPNNQKTLALLHKLKYSGKVYLVLDDQDSTIQEYIDNYGANSIIVFDKNSFINTTDTGLHNPVSKFAVYARNAVEHIATSLCYEYFMVLDDDVTNIRFRYDSGGSLKTAHVDGVLDSILIRCTEYMSDANIATLGLGFCNSYRGGVSVLYKENTRQRFCAEAFIRSTKFPIHWRLNMVEDLITSLDSGVRGEVWLQFIPLQVEIFMSEGVVSGGNSDAYNDFGKYKLSFFPTLVYPAFNYPRFINNHWVTTTVAKYSLPRILSSRYKHDQFTDA